MRRMSKILKQSVDRTRENVVAALDAGEAGTQAMSKAISTARRRIEELEEALIASENAREDAEKKVTNLEEKLRKVQATLA